jgi:hypothetical protein
MLPRNAFPAGDHIWTLALTFADVSAIQSHWDFRIERMIEGTNLAPSAEYLRLLEDAPLLEGVLEQLLQRQLDQRGMTITDLTAHLGTQDAVLPVFLALLEAVVSFCGCRAHGWARPVIQALRVMIEARRLEREQTEQEQTPLKAEQLRTEMPGGTSSGNSVPGPTATPGPTPMASSLAEPYPLPACEEQNAE